MAQRPLGLTLISAKDLKDVNLLSKMEVYAVASLSGDPRSRQRTQADRTGGRDHAWNATLRFTVPASGAGSLHVPLSGAAPAKFVSYQVRKINSGKAQGVLNFSYKLGEVTQPSTAGYAAPNSASAAYAQPPPAAAYPPASAYPPTHRQARRTRTHPRRPTRRLPRPTQQPVPS